MKSIQSFFFITVFSCAVFSQKNQAQICTWPAVKTLEQGSAVSTYTFHYWDYVKNHFSKYTAPHLQKIGIVVGDYHFNNVTMYYSNAEKKAQFAVADLDDAGQAPLLADYAKYIISIKEKFKKTNFKSILSSYIDGLKNQKNNNTPVAIQKIQNQNQAYFQRLNADYVNRKLNKEGHQFEKKYELDKIKHLDANYKPLAEQTEKSLAKTMTVLDSGFKLNASGSSLDLLRIQFLVSYQGSQQILELKQTRCPGTQLYQAQAAAEKRYKEVLPILNSEEYWKNTRLISYAKDQFIFRTKLASPIENIEIDRLKSSEAQNYAEYFAYLLGTLHSTQVNPQYIEQLETQIDSVNESIDHFANNYLEKLKKDMKENKRFL